MRMDANIALPGRRRAKKRNIVIPMAIP